MNSLLLKVYNGLQKSNKILDVLRMYIIYNAEETQKVRRALFSSRLAY